jgi:class 3 adenylate cyclase
VAHPLPKDTAMSIALRRDPPPQQRNVPHELLSRLAELVRELGADVGSAGAREAHDDPTRRLLALLFTDIVGSTGLAERLGNDAWSVLLGRHRAISRQEVDRFGGREIDNAGDGFFIAFDRPGRALACAEALRARLAALGLAIRAGVHSGECDVTSGKVTGVAVHVAARVCAMAGPDEILVSDTVRDLVAGSEFSFLDRAWCSLKGLSEPRHLFALASPTGARIVRPVPRLPCVSTAPVGP